MSRAERSSGDPQAKGLSLLYSGYVVNRAFIAVVSSCALAVMPLGARAVTTHAAACTKARAEHCVVKPHRVAVSTMYYQNASKVGGTALAGYPLLRARYGVAPNVEVFYDAPTELAISSHGAHYEMAHAGLGAQGTIAQDGGVALMLTAQSRPPLSPLANLYVLPLADVHVTAAWAETNGANFAAQLGMLNYIATNRGHRRSSMFDTASATAPIAPGTWFAGEVGMQSNATYGSAGETRGIASVKHSIGSNSVFNVDLGTTLNAAGGSKPHYLGAGFTFLP
ncbi:MAG TPA: hypothetical protein VMG98_08215 [Verrucomicrobiae bacterium]|nr:hypothetical protein [Verrucomicrobiae bacterium]